MPSIHHQLHHQQQPRPFYADWLSENVHRGVILAGRALTEQEAQTLLKHATDAIPDMEFIVVEPPS